MTKLTKLEQETIILENRAEKEAMIYTYDPKLKRRLRTYSKKHPEICRLDSMNFFGGETYVLNKDRLSLRLLAPVSEKHRKAERELGNEGNPYTTGKYHGNVTSRLQKVTSMI